MVELVDLQHGREAHQNGLYNSLNLGGLQQIHHDGDETLGLYGETVTKLLF